MIYTPGAGWDVIGRDSMIHYRRLVPTSLLAKDRRKFKANFISAVNNELREGLYLLRQYEHNRMHAFMAVNEISS